MSAFGWVDLYPSSACVVFPSVSATRRVQCVSWLPSYWVTCPASGAFTRLLSSSQRLRWRALDSAAGPRCPCASGNVPPALDRRPCVRRFLPEIARSLTVPALASRVGFAASGSPAAAAPSPLRLRLFPAVPVARFPARVSVVVPVRYLLALPPPRLGAFDGRCCIGPYHLGVACGAFSSVLGSVVRPPSLAGFFHPGVRCKTREKLIKLISLSLFYLSSDG